MHEVVRRPTCLPKEEIARRGQELATRLGLNMCYWPKLVGGRLELHTPWGVVYEPPAVKDRYQLDKMTKQQLRNLARKLNAEIKSRATKAELVAAIRQMVEP